jgi:hypothetical protein
MNLRIGVASVIPLSLALVVLLVLAGLGVIAWTVPISVAVALVVLAVFVGWQTRRTQSHT